MKIKLHIGNCRVRRITDAISSVAHSTPITRGESLYIPQGVETDTSMELSFDDHSNAQNIPGDDETPVLFVLSLALLWISRVRGVNAFR